MSEKRFEVINARWQGKGEAVAFEDIQTNQVYFAENQGECERIVDLMNQQQATIERLQDLCGESDYENAKLRLKSKELQEEIKLLKPTNIEQYEQIQKLQEENEKLKNRLNSDL